MGGNICADATRGGSGSGSGGGSGISAGHITGIVVGIAVGILAAGLAGDSLFWDVPCIPPPPSSLFLASSLHAMLRRSDSLHASYLCTPFICDPAHAPLLLGRLRRVCDFNPDLILVLAAQNLMTVIQLKVFSYAHIS